MRHAIAALAGLSTLAALTILAAPAAAQTAIDRADARCALVLQAVARDPKQKEAATRVVLFYVGRLSARGPLARVEAILLAEARTLKTAQQAQAELERCGREFNQRANEYQAVNQRIAQTVRAAAAPAAPPAK